MNAILFRHRFELNAPCMYDINAYHGESFALQATITRNSIILLCLANPKLYWQSADMGDRWYEAPATVQDGILEAEWTPNMDAGADMYRIFLSAQDEEGGTLYRANYNLRLIASPGFEPSSIPLPTRSIDFATVEIQNAPWITREELDEALDAYTSTPPEGTGDEGGTVSDEALEAHTIRIDNPHCVTAEQVGALPSSYYNETDEYVIENMRTLTVDSTVSDVYMFSDFHIDGRLTLMDEVTFRRYKLFVRNGSLAIQECNAK